jgi:hypothetical protein
MAENSTHLNPVKRKMQLFIKFKYAGYQARNAVNVRRRAKIARMAQVRQLQEMAGISRSKARIIAPLVIIVAVLVPVVALNHARIANFLQNPGSSFTAHAGNSQNSSGSPQPGSSSGAPNSGQSNSGTPSSSGSPSASTPPNTPENTPSPANSTTPSETSTPPSAENLKLSETVRATLLQHYKVADFASIKAINPKDMASHIYNILDSGSSQVVIILDLKYSDVARADVKNCAGELFAILKDKLPTLNGLVVATNDNYYTERVKRQ